MATSQCVWATIAVLVGHAVAWFFPQLGCQQPACQPQASNAYPQFPRPNYFYQPMMAAPNYAMVASYPAASGFYPQAPSNNYAMLSSPQQQQLYSQPPSPPQQSYSQPSLSLPSLSSPQSFSQLSSTAQKSYSQPSLPPQSSYSEPPAPAYLEPPPPPVYVAPPPKCFRNVDGMKCCNNELNQILDDAINRPQAEWDGCNLQKMANALQKMAQEKFGHSFESLVGSGSVVHRTKYEGELTCERRTRSGRSLKLFATPVPYVLGPDEQRPMTAAEVAQQNYSASYHTLSPYDKNGL